MSRNGVSLVAALTLLLSSHATRAQEPPPQFTDIRSEMAYRVALGRADDVRILVGKGANVNDTNPEGLPFLLVAASRKDPEGINVMQALLEGGANVNAKDAQGQTALYYAARNGKLDMVDYLLKAKIDYYSLDKNGDIARTIAFRAGFTDIVKRMDDFVKSQTLQVQNIGQNIDTMLKEQQEAQAKAEAQRVADEAKLQAQELAKRRQQIRQRALKYRKNFDQLKDKVYNISFNACAFQYWSFCKAMNQTTDLSEERLDATLEMHRAVIKSTGLEVMQMFDTNQAYIERITEPSKQYINTELSKMPSRTYRREAGVGTFKDLFKRCDKIAKNWQVSLPKGPQIKVVAKKPANKKKRSNVRHVPVGAAARKAAGLPE